MRDCSFLTPAPDWNIWDKVALKIASKMRNSHVSHDFAGYFWMITTRINPIH